MAAKVVVTLDTEAGTCVVMVNGQLLENICDVNICKSYDYENMVDGQPKEVFRFSASTKVVDNAGVRQYMHVMAKE